MTRHVAAQGFMTQKRPKGTIAAKETSRLRRFGVTGFEKILFCHSSGLKSTGTTLDVAQTKPAFIAQ
jgi:hypothetical protein